MKIEIKIKSDFWDIFAAIASYFSSPYSLLSSTIDKAYEEIKNMEFQLPDNVVVYSTPQELECIINTLMNKWRDSDDFQVLNLLEDALKKSKDSTK